MTIGPIKQRFCQLLLLAKSLQKDSPPQVSLQSLDNFSLAYGGSKEF